MLVEKSDGELIKLHTEKSDHAAIRVLVERHYDRLFKRFARETGNYADASDLSQQLWLQVTRNLKNYQDEGKFPQFLSTIASNVLNDYWRQKGTRGKYIVAADDLNDVLDVEPGSEDPERDMASSQLIEKMVTELIPALPVEQRMAWLLKHESEYWEPGKQLEWAHLAELNGMNAKQAWDIFEDARNTCLRSALGVNTDNDAKENVSDNALDAEQQLIFMVWTQSNRVDKQQNYTWDYFSNVLGVPVNTLKTRYRSAQKSLAEGLE